MVAPPETIAELQPAEPEPEPEPEYEPILQPSVDRSAAVADFYNSMRKTDPTVPVAEKPKKDPVPVGNVSVSDKEKDSNDMSLSSPLSAKTGPLWTKFQSKPVAKKPASPSRKGLTKSDSKVTFEEVVVAEEEEEVVTPPPIQTQDFAGEVVAVAAKEEEEARTVPLSLEGSSLVDDHNDYSLEGFTEELKEEEEHIREEENTMAMNYDEYPNDDRMCFSESSVQSIASTYGDYRKPVEVMVRHDDHIDAYPYIPYT